MTDREPVKITSAERWPGVRLASIPAVCSVDLAYVQGVLSSILADMDKDRPRAKAVEKAVNLIAKVQDSMIIAD